MYTRKIFRPISIFLSILMVFSIFVINTGTANATTDTKYIDPDNTTAPFYGTYDDPYNTWDQVTFAQDTAYLQKRDTTSTMTTMKTISVTDCVIGAYGTGARPIINNSITGLNTYTFNISNTTNVTISDIEFINNKNAMTSILFQGVKDSSNGIYEINNCVLRGAQWGIRSYNRYTGGLKILNCEIYNTMDDGIYVSGTSNVEIGYCYVHDINQYWFEPGSQDLPIVDSRAPGDCIQFGGDGHKNAKIHHNILDHSTTGNKFCIILYAPAGSDPQNTTIEYNHMIGQKLSGGGGVIYLHSNSDTKVRYNILEYGYNGVFFDTEDNSQVYGNIITDCNRPVRYSWKMACYPQLYNNTIVDCIYPVLFNSPTSTIDSRNNIFRLSKDGGVYDVGNDNINMANLTSDYNLIYPEKTNMIKCNGTYYSTLLAWKNAANKDTNSTASNPLFVDESNGDYRLGTNSPAIGTGVYIQGYTGSSPVNIGANAADLYATLISVNGGSYLYPRFAIGGGLTVPPVPPTAWYSKADFAAGTYNLSSGNTGICTMEYDVTPLASGIDGITGYADTSTTVDGFTKMSMVVRMNMSGYFDVRNGGAYAALSNVAYTANNTYHVKITANLNTELYDVYVTPEGGSQTQIADDYAFRSDTPAIDDIGKVALRSASDNQFKIGNHKIAPIWYSKADFAAGTYSLGSGNTGTRTIEYDVTPLASGIDGITGYADTSTTVDGFTKMSMVVRMNMSGYFDVRNGGAYAALSNVAYTANNTYHVKITANLSTELYDVYVTPEGGSQTQIADDYAFRSDAPAIDDIGKVTLRSANDNQFMIENHKIY